MDLQFVFERLGLALLLGSLVGLQREKAKSALAGFRTFPLVTILGTLCALLAKGFGTGVLIGGIFGIIALIVMGNIFAAKAGDERRGITTEVAVFVMFLVGAYLVMGNALVSIVITGGVAVLLQFKPQLHGFAKKLGDADLNAIMRFVIIAFIILPILPNETFGPFEVFNPQEVWMMVVFIVGLNLTGYIVSKFVGSNASTLTSGILGGMISSTATAVSFSQASKKEVKLFPQAMTIILISTTFAYIRVAMEVLGTSRSLFDFMIIPLAVLFGFSVCGCVVAYLYSKRNASAGPLKSTAHIRSALLFALTYTIVVLATAAAKRYLDPSSLYWVAGISGLTDVDAITLSTGRMVANGKLSPSIGQDMILIAAMSNLIFKTGIVAALGSRRLLWPVAIFFFSSVAVGVTILVIS